MRSSRHHPSASLPPSSERRACRCPKFAQSQRLPPRGSCHEVTEGVSRPQATESTIYYCCANIKTPPVSYRCHPPRRGGQTVNLPATMSWVDIVARKAIAIQQKTYPLRRDLGSGALHRKHQSFHIAERKATKHPQQLLNLSPRKERQREEQK